MALQYLPRLCTLIAAGALALSLGACSKDPEPAQAAGPLIEAKAPPPARKVRTTPQPEDSIVSVNVLAALRANPKLQGLDLAVNTKHGVVELRGTVDNIDQWSLAVDVASTADGVDSVVNQLDIKK